MATNVIETREVSATPTVDTSIYASGDCIGSVLTFSNALRSYTSTGRVIQASILDKTAASTLAACSLWLFSASPSSSTTTDQAAFNLHDSDIAKVCSVLVFSSFEVVDGGTANQFLQLTEIARPVRGTPPTTLATGDSTLYGLLVSGGTPTFGAASDVIVRLTIECDQGGYD